MKRIGILVTLAVSLTLVGPPSALAGIYSDELAKCLVKSTTDADRTFLTKWIFASVAVHPAVRSIALVSEADRVELNKGAARLVERLITDACKAETLEAVKFEGPAVFQSSFEVLGQVAGRGLLSDPAVAKSMTEFATYLDKQKFEKVFGPAR